MHHVRLILINVAVFVGLLVVGIAVLILIPSQRAQDTRKGITALPNYVGADWIAQYDKESDALDLKYYSYIGWRRKPFHGETINVVGDYGERLTVQAADPKPQSVFFFGGSTMWGTGSRDVDTIASQFAAKTGLRARNFGETAYTAHQNLEMMIKLLENGERPTAVVFYDGVNDIVTKCRRELDYYSDAREARNRLAVEPSAFTRTYGAIIGQLATLFTKRDLSETYECDVNPKKADAVATALVSDWKIASVVARLYGVRFYAVLQPVVYYSHTRTDYLKTDVNGGYVSQYRAVYPRIRKLMIGTPFRDLTDAFDRDEAIYIDFCHVSPNGNAIMAARLADFVVPDILAAGGS